MGRPRIIDDKLVLMDGKGNFTPISRLDFMKVCQDNGITPEFLAKVIMGQLQATDKEGNPDNAAIMRALGFILGDVVGFRKIAPSKADKNLGEPAPNPLDDIIKTAGESQKQWSETLPPKVQ